ncbi:MAG TPA: hypothetical protein VFV95_06550 [Vicinamibacterales bacterium]|nr:hypothetical protein [Vicinamibacterales bacterium]
MTHLHSVGKSLRRLRRNRAALCCGLLIGTLFAAHAEAQRLSMKKLRFAKHFDWVTKESPNFEFFYEAGTPAARDIDRIVKSMEDSRGRVERLLGKTSKIKLQNFFVESRQRMKDLIGFETNAYAYGTISTMIYNDEVESIGAHQTCHVLAESLWGDSREEWIEEGLAVYANDQWRGLPLHSVAKWLLDRDRLVPVAGLVKNGWQQKHSNEVTYPQLGSFVKFVYEKYGMDPVKQLWKRGARDSQAALGKPLTDVEREWKAELGKVDASRLDYSAK